MFSTTPSDSSTNAFGSPLSFGPQYNMSGHQSSTTDMFGHTYPPCASRNSVPGLLGSMLAATPSSGSTTSSQVPATIAPSLSGFSSNGITSFGQTTVPWVSSSFCGTQSSLPVEKEEGKMLVSISAMPCYQDKSHEELRWEDHHQLNAGGVGVVPASVQSNDFRNPIARTDRTFASPIPHSVRCNPFFPVVTPSIRQDSFLNPAPPSVLSNPLGLSVTSNPSAPQNQQKLQCEKMDKSVQLICKDVLRHQEDMKSWIERYRSLELGKMEDTQTIKQLREELAQVTKSKDAIIAEYLESPTFTKRLDEEHEKRLSEIFQSCYVTGVRSVQTKLAETVQPKSSGTVQTKLAETDAGEFVYKAVSCATGGAAHILRQKKKQQELI